MGELFPGGKIKWDDYSKLAEEELPEEQKFDMPAEEETTKVSTQVATARTLSHEEIAERWEALAEATKSCRPEEPKSKILIAVALSKMPNWMWNQMMGAPNENALLALFKAGFGEEVERLLSPEQIRVLPDKVARVGAQYGCQLPLFKTYTKLIIHDQIIKF